MPRRSATSGSSRTLKPSMRMSPSSNGTSRRTRRTAVVLPQPDGPTSVQNVPAGISSESSRKAGSARPGYRFVTRSKTISAPLTPGRLYANGDGHVAAREDTGHARLEQVRVALELPASRGGDVRAREHEAARVERDFRRKPTG